MIADISVIERHFWKGVKIEIEACESDDYTPYPHTHVYIDHDGRDIEKIYSCFASFDKEWLAYNFIKEVTYLVK